MSEHERGAYAPPTETSLSFDPRQPVRGSRPIPFTLIIAVLVLAGLAAAIFVFYQSGVRRAGQPPQAVGAPVADMKAPPPAEAQPQDPAAGLQIYKSEDGASAAPSKAVQFAPPPEQPQARPQPGPPAPTVVVTQAAPAAPAPALRPSIETQGPASAVPAQAPKAEAPPAKAAPAPKIEKPVAKAPPAPAAVAAKPAPVKPAKAEPAPVASAGGAASVQIGAFSSQALADKGWNDAAAVAPGASAGKGKSVEKVERDGHTLFRTQVTGFASRADATAFCGKLKAAGKACFVK
jgi:cytoskeletal protein RodZ